MSQRFTNWLYKVTGGLVGRKDPDRWLDLGVNIKEFGAIADGFSHPLSSIYADLAAAQVDYPFVDDLILEVDGVATQAANDWMWANGGSRRKLFAPAGTYKSSLPIFIDPAGHMRGEHDKWAVGTTYDEDDVVTWNGIPWISLTDSNVGNKPFVARGLDSGGNAGEIIAYRNQYYRAMVDNATWWQLVGFVEPYDAAPDDVNWELASSTLHWTPHYDQPTEFNHSFYFCGDEGVPSALNNLGTTFKFGNMSFGFIGGPGNGNLWEGIQVTGLNDSGAWGYRKGQPSGGIAFAQAGGAGGASRTHWRNCEAYNFRTLWKTGFNADALCDSNSWEKCNGGNGYIGFEIAQTQNFINTIFNCSVSATRGVVSELGGGAHILAGNPSSDSSRGGALAVSNVSALTVTGVGNQFNISLTAEVVPDNYLRAGVYEYAFIRTAHFGVMPFRITVFDEDTNIVSLEGLPEYIGFYFGAHNPKTTTDLEAELQAPDDDLLYCAELITVVSGTSITMEKVHIENAQGATCLINNGAGFGSGAPNTIKSVIYNYDPALPFWRPSANPSAANLAKYYAATILPFIRMHNAAGCDISDCYLGMQNDPCTVSWVTDSAYPLTVRNTVGFRPNIVCGGNATFDAFGARTIYSQGNLGAGLNSDRTPFLSWNFPQDQDAYRRTGWNASPFDGYRPSVHAVPTITPAQLTALQSLPAITYVAYLKGGLGSNYGVNLSAAGTGYTAGDVLTLVGGTGTAATIGVWAVNGSGVITDWYTVSRGAYTVAPSSFTVTGGTGSGATFNQPHWLVEYSALYPALWGGQIYKLGDWYMPAPADRVVNVVGGGGGTITLPGARHLSSDHHFYSLGQDLTTSNMPKCAWSYKGQSYAVYCDEEVMAPLWGGQGILLDNGADPEALYIVTGKMPGLGYFMVASAGSVTDDTHLVGDKNTVFTGTVIGQEPYDITPF